MKTLSSCIVIFALCAQSCWGRIWTDVTGQFKVEADLVAADDSLVVLRTEKGNLLAIQIAQLSERDRQYLTSSETRELVKKLDVEKKYPGFKLIEGTEVVGPVTGYDITPLVVYRKSGDVMVGETVYKKLVPIYKEIVPEIVGHFESAKLKSERDLEEWLEKSGPAPHSYQLETVSIQTVDQGTVKIPLFMFDPRDRYELDAGFARWKALHEAEVAQAEKENHLRDELIRARVTSRYRNNADVAAAVRESNFRMMQLNLLAADAGVTDIWEVSLVAPFAYAQPISVMIAARDSRTAEAMALKQYSKFTVNYVRKASEY